MAALQYTIDMDGGVSDLIALARTVQQDKKNRRDHDPIQLYSVYGQSVRSLQVHNCKEA